MFFSSLPSPLPGFLFKDFKKLTPSVPPGEAWPVFMRSGLKFTFVHHTQRWWKVLGFSPASGLCAFRECSLLILTLLLQNQLSGG